MKARISISLVLCALLAGVWYALLVRPQVEVLAFTLAGHELELLAPRWLGLAALAPLLWLLAAGSLEDIIGQAIDADEAKALVVLCTDGEIKVTGAAANGLGCFTAASEGNALSEGQFVAIGLGKAGLDVTVNSKFDITETSGTATAAYTLGLIVAQ